MFWHINTLCELKNLCLILLCFLSIPVSGKEDLKSLSEYLDRIIDNKQQFVGQKEQKINSLKNLLNEKDYSLKYEYEINQKLYAEYQKLKVDSAIYYAERNVQIAEMVGEANLKYSADITLASFYSYSGKFIESEAILKKIDSHDLPQSILGNYYEAYLLFYEHYSTMTGQSNYWQLINAYRDSLLSVLDHSSFGYKMNMVQKYMSSNETKKAEDLLYSLLDAEEENTPEYARITHSLAGIHGVNGKSELEKIYYIKSAIADVKNSIKENASFHRLALIYYNSGDITRAFKYTQSAIEDAVYSGVQFRTAEMSRFYSIINASFQADKVKKNGELKKYLLLISVLSLFLILLVGYIYSQMKKLSKIKEELSMTNDKLVELNKELNEKNDLLHDKNTQLWESNRVKEQYIAQFFDLCSTYIDKMEDYRKTLYKLGINRQYEELIKKLKSTTAVENELEELYSHFDRIFLNLYPTFVSDFNSLLAKDEQINLKAEDLLTKDLRIYALLRLGITDSLKIAGFLRCSMSTIYNYRTKMRNKAASDREEFEDLVMKIGMTRKIH